MFFSQTFDTNELVRKPEEFLNLVSMEKAAGILMGLYRSGDSLWETIRSYVLTQYNMPA